MRNFIGYAEVKMCVPEQTKLCCGSVTESMNSPVIFNEFYKLLPTI